jgi:hypothetical protein
MQQVPPARPAPPDPVGRSGAEARPQPAGPRAPPLAERRGPVLRAARAARRPADRAAEAGRVERPVAIPAAPAALGPADRSAWAGQGGSDGEVTATPRSQTVGGGAVFAPVLQGNAKHARTYARRGGANRQIGIVMIADAPARGPCPSDNLAAAVTAAEYQFRAAPPIRTTVIGIGPGLNELEAVAAAAGTQRAHLIDTSGPAVAAAIQTALDSAARPCEYGHPVNVPGGIDPVRVKLQWRAGPNGASAPLTYAGSATGCGNTPAWFTDNPSSPSRVSLCPATCEQVAGTPGNEVWYFFDCGSAPSPLR